MKRLLIWVCVVVAVGATVVLWLPRMMPSPKLTAQPLAAVVVSDVEQKPEAKPVVTAEPTVPKLTTAPDVPKPNLAGIGPAVLTIIGADPAATNFMARSAAMRKFTTKLSKADATALLDFLNTPFDVGNGMTLIRFNSLKNDVLTVLVNQQELLPELGSRIVEMSRNPSNDVVWRDYCIQYMAPYYERSWKPGTDPGENLDRKAIRGAHEEALKQTSTTLAGTALLSWQTLSAKYPEFDPQEVPTQALALATNDRALDAPRITAFSLCATLGLTNALPSARTAAQAESSIPLRMAAIRVIGALGTEADKELLTALAADSQKPVALFAAKTLAAMKIKADAR